jgi:N-acetylmuramoyl-L-alanine amidase
MARSSESASFWVGHRASPPRHRAGPIWSGVVVLVCAVALVLTAVDVGASDVPNASASAASGALQTGSSGPAVLQLQQRLTALGFRPGEVDGRFGAATASAVLAFQKRSRLPRTSIADAATLAALQKPLATGPIAGAPGLRIEVDIDRQILFVIQRSGAVVTLNVSTGSGKTYRAPNGRKDVAYTPIGTFTVVRKIQGVRHAALGNLYDPMYFYQGWAIHGSPSVPAYPASHGCVRVSNADAAWLSSVVPVGTRIQIYDASHKDLPVSRAPADAAPGA